MLLIIDNYDLFVFNIARYCEELGQRTLVVRNDKITVEDAYALKPASIILSPGPRAPKQAGVSMAILRRFSGRIPILGICLGHQCIGAAFGGEVAKAKAPMHGRSSLIDHCRRRLFDGLPLPLQVGRYNSLCVEARPAMLESLRIDAVTEEGEVMALSHRLDPTYGVQFHPESVLTDAGYALFENFFGIAERWLHDGMDQQ